MAKLIISGTPVSSVCVTHGTSPAELTAADELAGYLRKLCGVGLAPDGYPVALSVDKSVGADGYSVVNSGGCLKITGGNGRGVIYGVYALLEKFADARFYMPGLEKFGSGDVEIPDGASFAFTPPFEYRQSDWVCGADIGWSVKNRVNNRAIPEALGGYVSWGGFVHTMHNLVGTPYDKQPCLSDPAVLEQAKKSVRALLAANPSLSVVSVSQNDNQNYCKCDKCAAVDAEEGSHMGTLLRFVNAVAADIAGDYPDVAIDTLAYQYTRKAPLISRPLPNVIIRLCSIECCFSHPLADPTCPVNAAFAADIAEWNKICDRIYVWDYVTDFSYYIPPFPNFGTMRDNMRFFAAHGVKGMYPEGNYQAPSGEFGELRAYLLARLMYNPNMSAEEYERETDGFLAAYYGGGWRYIRAFLDLTVALAKKRHMSIWINPLALVDRDDYLALEDDIDGWWDKAEAAAGDRLGYVKRSRHQWTYVKLMLHPDAEAGKRFFDEVNAAGIRWNEWRNVTKEPDYATTPDKWEFS